MVGYSFDLLFLLDWFCLLFWPWVSLTKIPLDYSVSFSLYLFSDDLYCFDIILVWTVSLKEIYYLLVVFPFVIYNKFILEFIVISLGPFWSDGLPEVFCPFSFIYCVLPLADVILNKCTDNHELMYSS